MKSCCNWLQQFRSYTGWPKTSDTLTVPKKNICFCLAVRFDMFTVALLDYCLQYVVFVVNSEAVAYYGYNNHSKEYPLRWYNRKILWVWLWCCECAAQHWHIRKPVNNSLKGSKQLLWQTVLWKVLCKSTFIQNKKEQDETNQ